MRFRRGFTLLEVMVATTIMGIAVVTLLSALSTSVRNATRLTDYDRAVLLARAKMDALLAFIRQAQTNVTGDVSLNLYKGNIMVAGRQSGFSLYDAGIASMEGGGSYNQTDAEGFLRIQGLPLRVQARVAPRPY